MAEIRSRILSTILRKRLEFLGYGSLRRFHEDRPALEISYELLRQIVHEGRIPRTETLLRVLQAMNFSVAQAHKILEVHGRSLPRFPGSGSAAERNASPDPPGPSGETPEVPARPAGSSDEGRKNRSDAAAPSPDDPDSPPPSLPVNDPEEIAASLLRTMPKIPWPGNEDFWETLGALARQAERKVRDQVRRRADQPLLFEKEPEAIYQFLVRRGKTPAYMSRGDALTLSPVDGVDYRDRFRGALVGAAVGELLGRPAQGLSRRDVSELYGRIEGFPAARHGSHGRKGREPVQPAVWHLARTLLEAEKLDPDRTAAAYASAAGSRADGGLAEFARNLTERQYPWYEAGRNAAENAPAARVAPIALLRSLDFRRLKLEAGIDAAITHPNPAAVACAVAQAAAVAKLLHTPSGTLDVLGFTRSLSPAISGIEPDRAARARSGRPLATLWRKLGTELTALLLRRAEIEEIQEALGNGPSALEGLPFAWGCFLRFHDDFAATVLSAVNMGNDAESAGAIAGALSGAYLGAQAIPGRLADPLPWREELSAFADRLLALCRREG